jgi:hypothetical protein
MSKFKNISRRIVSLINSGKKINIHPGQVIDGPESFKMYKDLKKVNENEYENYKKTLQESIKYNRENIKYTDNDQTVISYNNVNVRKPLDANISRIKKVKQYINNFKNGVIPSVAVCLEGFNENTKKDIILHTKYNNYKIYENYTSDLILDEDIIIAHSADNIVKNDYISEVVKLSILSNVNIPKIYNIKELDKNWIRKDIIENYKETNTCYFSIVTLVNNLKQYNDFLDDLTNQYTTHDVEVIVAPNFLNIFTSCSEPLNMLKDVCNGEIVNYCHQDLRCDSLWVHKIITHIKQLDAQKIRWGVLGMAGSYLKTNPTVEYNVIYLGGNNSINYNDMYTKVYGSRKEVQCLDELALIMRKSDIIRFDEVVFNHFHFYGADICLQYIESGYINYAINAYCNHLSDGQSNMYKHKNDYINESVKLYRKWSKKFSSWKTTTANFDANKKLIIPLIFIIINQKNKNKDFPQTIVING